uniref:Uncharacterized protein At1g76070 n=1 Tax=Anthurium amnicola TaxID=1678845 RepID=A0A1D1ZGW6_9ARAE
MMRTPSKVMMVSSSPGRAEKLPAPLLSRLLRGKGGSRSRGRSSSLSRSSPMFVARRRSASSVDIHDEKEPSSPKVTCIGQVRINKRKCSTSFSSSSSSRSKQQPQGCRCLQRGFFCNPFSRRLNVRFGRPPSSAPSPPPYRHHPPRPRGWRRWLLLPRPGCYWQRKAQRQQQHLWEEDGPGTPAGAPAAKPGSDDEGERSEQGDTEEDEEEETKVFVPTNPPKNALLLMRCRSAPHRPACPPDRFWVSSPYGAEGDGAAGGAAAPAPWDVYPSHREHWGGETLSNDSVATRESRVGIHDSVDEQGEGEEEDREVAAVGPSPSFSSRPLILTRCKSEPARRAAKLAAPEASYCFWNGGSINKVNNAKSKSSKRWLTLLGEPRPINSQTQ